MKITKEQYEEALKIVDQYRKEQPDYIDGYTVEMDPIEMLRLNEKARLNFAVEHGFIGPINEFYGQP
jgi:hypothetical protein